MRELSAKLTEGEIHRINATPYPYKKGRSFDRPFREPMQLGSLRFERPPDVQIYLPSFCERKRISLSAESDSRRCPKNPQVFSKKT